MIKEIESRRSIRKFKSKAVNKSIIEEMIYAATLAPSAKNRQPWKFLVYQGEKKSELVEVMRKGVQAEKVSHELMPNWAAGIADAENTIRVMEESPVLIVVLNTNQKTPFSKVEGEGRIVEICDSLSIGAAVQNMLLTASEHNLGTLWIANTCFAYNDLIEFLDTKHQLTGIIAVGMAAENPDKRPRKSMEDIVEWI